MSNAKYIPREFRNSGKVLGCDTAIVVNGKLHGVNITERAGAFYAVCPDMEDCECIADTRESVMSKIEKLIPECKPKEKYVKPRNISVQHKRRRDAGARKAKGSDEIPQFSIKDISEIAARRYEEGFIAGMAYAQQYKDIIQ